MIQDLLHGCLYPVMLGSNAACHACVRQMQKEYGIDSTVLTGKRAITLRFLPNVKLIHAASDLNDELLLAILRDVELECGARVPLLILCDKAYEPFWKRNLTLLQSGFILREAKELLGGSF